MTEQLTEHIDCIPVPLPGNPLKQLNSYVIKTPERNLIIDTGFKMAECLQAMRAGIAELELDMSRTDLFITHYHADHCGLIHDLATPTTKIYMHRADCLLFHDAMDEKSAYWKQRREHVLALGYPPEEFRRSTEDNPIVTLSPSEDFPFAEVEDGDVIALNGIRLRVVHTPGHTPGHSCLYWEEEEILLCGDCVLYTITPNITDWEERNALGEFLDSLRRIGQLRVRTGLAAHRQNGPPDFYTRIDQLVAHHRARLDEAMSIVRADPGVNVYQVASRMQWSIRAKGWDDFPPNQKWFAVGEAFAHLVYLEQQGAVQAEQRDGARCYTVIED